MLHFHLPACGSWKIWPQTCAKSSQPSNRYIYIYTHPRIILNVNCSSFVNKGFHRAQMASFGCHVQGSSLMKSCKIVIAIQTNIVLKSLLKIAGVKAGNVFLQILKFANYMLVWLLYLYKIQHFTTKRMHVFAIFVNYLPTGEVWSHNKFTKLGFTIGNIQVAREAF